MFELRRGQLTKRVEVEVTVILGQDFYFFQELMCESERERKERRGVYLFCLTVEIILKYLHFHILRKNASKKNGGEVHARWGHRVKNEEHFSEDNAACQTIVI